MSAALQSRRAIPARAVAFRRSTLLALPLVLVASGCCFGTLNGHEENTSGTGASSGGTTTGAACVPGPPQNLESPVVLKPPPNSIVMMTSADLNRDGMLDLIVAAGSGLLAGLGHPDGRVDPPGFFYTTYTVGGAIAAADLNGDGWPDVIASSAVPDRPGLKIFLNDGTGTLASPAFTPTPAVAAQLDLGHLVSGELPALVLWAPDDPDSAAQVMLNAGDGTFAPPVHLRGVQGSLGGALAVGDLNQDGLADIVGTTLDDTGVVVLINQGDGGYQSRVYPTTFESSVAVLPRAGRAPDLLVEIDLDAGETGIQLLVNAGDGTFSDGPIYPLQSPGSIVVGDFNNDCIPDIATTTGFGCGNGSGVALLYGDGDGGFGPPKILPYAESDAGGQAFALALLGPVGSPHALAVGDFCRGTITIYGDASR